MKRPVRESDGTYHLENKKFKELFGSRQQVWNGTAYKTSGGLKKADLLMNKWGRIVSDKKHKTAKKEMRLKKYGYTAKKGKFGYVKVKPSRRNNKSSKKKGGSDDIPHEQNQNQNQHEQNQNQQ
jgi:hypothetical protein